MYPVSITVDDFLDIWSLNRSHSGSGKTLKISCERKSELGPRVYRAHSTASHVIQTYRLNLDLTSSQFAINTVTVCSLTHCQSCKRHFPLFALACAILIILMSETIDNMMMMFTITGKSKVLYLIITARLRAFPILLLSRAPFLLTN